jgi:hypothetical protein
MVERLEENPENFQKLQAFIVSSSGIWRYKNPVSCGTATNTCRGAS